MQNIEGFSEFGKIYDFYNTDEFEIDSIWIDPDHVNEEGAQIFTKALNEKLKQDRIIKS